MNEQPRAARRRFARSRAANRNARGEPHASGRPAAARGARAPLRWYPLREAAVILGLSPDALRKQLERNVIRARDGGTEALVDGVRARKFANRWRISFGEAWTEAR